MSDLIMWRVFVLTLSLLSGANTYTPRLSQKPYSAASESQIKFAIENKYDDTGPGAKGQEYAYHTYKTLEDALVSYLDDPDTLLPEQDREKGLNILQRQEQANYNSPTNRPLLNPVENYNVYTKQSLPPAIPLNINNEQTSHRNSVNNYGFMDLRGLEYNDIPTRSYQKERVNDAFSFQKVQAVKGSPLSLAHYTRDPSVEESQGQFDANPLYSFSYGVHDKHTGDSKSAQETREDGVVRGFYSFIDADGKQRTVHYTADDKEGFKAIVKRTHANIQ